MAGVSGNSIFEVESTTDVVEDEGLIILAEDSMIPYYVISSLTPSFQMSILSNVIRWF